MPTDFLFDPRIDEAAFAGFDAFTTKASEPDWTRTDPLLHAAWLAGRRQAEDKAREATT